VDLDSTGHQHLEKGVTVFSLKKLMERLKKFEAILPHPLIAGTQS
jgi:hypothetical protein